MNLKKTIALCQSLLRLNPIKMNQHIMFFARDK